jgi:hypothetical protein
MKSYKLILMKSYKLILMKSYKLILMNSGIIKLILPPIARQNFDFIKRQIDKI